MEFPQSDPIKHIVVLMLENRSFDQMLGALQEVYPTLEGVDPQNPRSNRDADGLIYHQASTTTLCIEPDPKHELKNVLRQIGLSETYVPPPKVTWWQQIREWIGAILGIALSWVRPKRRMLVEAALKPYEGAFVLDYSLEYPASTPPQRQEIMNYFPLDFLPAHHALARDFTICDHWFSSVPGPTWANRFFVHSGSSAGRVTMPESREEWLHFRPYTQTTLYDRLDERGIRWRIYFGDIPQSLALARQLHRQNVINYFPMQQFYQDAVADEREFPAYSFIEPSYFVDDADDDHPPHNTMRAQALIANVYNTFRSNPALWKSTLFVVMYDEHGGFYDHVESPECVCPYGLNDEYSFERLGVRVPVMLVSPWVDRGVVSTPFDHTSLLKYVSDKWKLGPLGERVARQQHSIRDSTIRRSAHRHDRPHRSSSDSARGNGTSCCRTERSSASAPGPQRVDRNED